MVIRFAGHTDKGILRSGNEDAFSILFVDSHERKCTRVVSGELELQGAHQAVFAVVADGMGGASAGEVASQIAVETVEKAFSAGYFPVEASEIRLSLTNILYQAHQCIVEHARAHQESVGMGTTLSIAMLTNEQMHFVWCGDSRIYRYAPQGVSGRKHYDLEHLEILTSDHSMVWEMVEQYQLSAEEARLHPNSNIITQSLGDVHNPPQPDYHFVDLFQDDKIMLCSDGLNGMVSDFYISKILEQSGTTIELVEGLIDTANNSGGGDNITVILIEVVQSINQPVSIKPKKREIITKQMTFPDGGVSETSEGFEQAFEPNISGQYMDKDEPVRQLVTDKKGNLPSQIIALAVLLGILLGLGFIMYTEWTETRKAKPSIESSALLGDSVFKEPNPIESSSNNQQKIFRSPNVHTKDPVKPLVTKNNKKEIEKDSKTLGQTTIGNSNTTLPMQGQGKPAVIGPDETQEVPQGESSTSVEEWIRKLEDLRDKFNKLVIPADSPNGNNIKQKCLKEIEMAIKASDRNETSLKKVFDETNGKYESMIRDKRE